MSTQRMTRAQVPMEEMILSPGSTCQGCGAAMAARLTFKVLGPNLIRHGIPCCPDHVTKHPRQGAVFEGGGSSLTGSSRALKALGDDKGAAQSWEMAKAVPIENDEDKAILDGDLAVGP